MDPSALSLAALAERRTTQTSARADGDAWCTDPAARAQFADREVRKRKMMICTNWRNLRPNRKGRERKHPEKSCLWCRKGLVTLPLRLPFGYQFHHQPPISCFAYLRITFFFLCLHSPYGFGFKLIRYGTGL